MFSLARHKAKATSGYASYTATGLDEWHMITRGRGCDSKTNSKTGDFSERFMLIDPSDVCSWEEIGRPSLRSQAIEDDDERDGYGVGNVRFVTMNKSVTMLGAEAVLTGKDYLGHRVRELVSFCHTYACNPYFDRALHPIHGLSRSGSSTWKPIS